VIARVMGWLRAGRGWLDRRPTWARDGIVAVAGALTLWAGQDVVPMVRESGALGAALAQLLVLAVGAATRWTQRYGAGRSAGEQAELEASVVRLHEAPAPAVQLAQLRSGVAGVTAPTSPGRGVSAPRRRYRDTP
jgi:hypothetical protein